MIKLGEKAKIFLAILAVVVVAAGAVAVTALSANANDAQNGLNAGNDQGAPLARASSDSFDAYFQYEEGIDDVYDGTEHFFQLMFDDYDGWDYLEDVSIKGYDFNGGEIADNDIDASIDINYKEVLFTVVKSGNYYVTLTWNDPNMTTTTMSFTVSQILIAGSTSLEENGVKMSEISYSPDLTVDDILSKLKFSPSTVGADSQAGKYTLQYGLFVDQNYTTQVTNSDLKIGGTYYAKAINVLPYSAGDKAYLDYRLPIKNETGFNGICSKVTLAGPKLADPIILDEFYKSHKDINFNTDRTRITVDNDNGVISAVYLGFGYKISQWFYDMNGHDKWADTYDSGENWIVTVNGTSVNPNTYEMMKVGTYKVVIKPKEGYQFTTEGLTSREINLTIKPYKLTTDNIEWKDQKHEYTGNPIAIGEGDYEVVNLFGNDTLSLQFERIGSDKSAPVNAGRYIYSVKSIVANEYSSNYELGDITNEEPDPNGGSSATRGKFIIYKQTLPDFKANGPLITATYNGQSQYIGLYQYFQPLGLGDRITKDGETSYLPYITNIGNIVRAYPSEWGLGNNTFTNDASFTPSMDNQDEFFHVTYAGSYTVEFVMQTGTSFRENYCWFGASNDPDSASNVHYVWTNFALIERAEVDPLFEPTNILTNYDEAYDIASLVADKFQGLGDVYTLAYGKEGQTGTSATPLHGTTGNYLEGNYYVLISINEDVYPNVYFKAAQDNEYNVSGRQARIDYSVTSSTVSISCNVKDSYIFGDNFDSAFKVVTVNTKPADGVTYGNITITYYDVENNEIADASLLANGSPRNAGKYFVVITVDYMLTTESGSENLVWTSRTYDLTVNKRQVTLVWYVDGDTTSNFTYDGNSHAVTAVNTNLIEGVTNVTITVNNATVTNAGTHDFSVDDTCIQGDEAGNYTLVGVTNTTFTVTIGKASVTVTANSVANVTYGKGGLNSSNLTVTVNPDGIEGQSNITIAVYNSSNQLVTDYVNINMGAYTVVPVWGEAPATMPTLTGGKYVTEQGNYSIEMVTTTFSVTAQAIKVTFKTGMSSVYGDEINLWSAIDTITSGDDVFNVEQLKEIASVTATRSSVVITATKDGVTVTGATRANVANNYALGIKSNSADYDITTTGKAVNYAITARPVTYTVPSVNNHPYGEYYEGLKYSKPTLTSGSIVDGDMLSTACAVMAMVSGEKVPTSNITTSLDGATVGHYYLLVRVNSSSGTLHWDDENGYYYYEMTVGNYRVTSIAADFIIVPRIITLTFTNGSSTYGDSINLWAQKSTGLSSEQKYYIYNYVTASNLRLHGGDYSDYLKDVIDLSLFVDNTSYNPSTDKINAYTYAYKATVKNSNYKIADGENAVDEFIGGQFVVNKKAITVNTTTSVSSIIYGNTLDASVLNFNVVTANGLVNGDTKESIGVTAGIFNGSENVTSTISSQNVGGYTVDLVGTSTNYAITVQNKASLTISKRSATITANNVLGHVYGEALSGSFGITYEAKNGDRGFVDDSHWQGLGVTANVSGNVSSLAVKEGGYAITLAITNTSDAANTNYNITLTNGTLQIVQREITITANSISDHVYGTALGNKLDGAYSVEVTNGTGNAFVSEADKASLAIAIKIYNGEVLIDNDNVAELDVATYDLKVAYTANSNYKVNVVNGEFKVIKLELTIIYVSGKESVYGETLTEEDLKAAYTVKGTLLEGDELIVTAFHNQYPEISLLDYKAPKGRYMLTVKAPNSNYDVTYENTYEVNGDSVAYRIKERTVNIIANDVQHTYGDALGENELSYRIFDDIGKGIEPSPYDILEGDTINTTIEVLKNGVPVAVTDISKLDVGEYTISLNVIEPYNTNYTVTPCAPTGFEPKFKVVARNVTVTPNEVTNHVYGEAGSTLTITGDNFVDDAHLTAMGITAKVYNGNTLVNNVATLHVGTYEIRLDYPTAKKNNNYNVTLETADFIVVARNITITANNVSHTYGDALGNKLTSAYSVTCSNGAGNALVGTDNLSITLSIHNVANSDVATLAYKDGGYAIDVNYDTTNEDYAVTTVGGTFTVNKRIVTVTFTNDGDSSVYGEAVNYNSSNVYTYSNNLVNVSGINDVINLSCAATSTSDVGEYAVTATVINGNYDVEYANDKTAGKYTIIARKITITPASVTHTYGDALGNNLTANGAYGVVVTNGTGNAFVSEADKASLAITLQVYNGETPVANADVAKLGVNGSYSIKVSYTANDNYNVDNSATATFTVTKRTINLSFNNLSSTYGDVLASNILDTLYSVTNLAEGDELTVTAKKGTHKITDVNAPAGLYIVTVEASDNYTIAYDNDIENGSYTINKRPISVAIDKTTVEYTEDVVDGVIDYHNGEYGATQNVTASFTNLKDEFVLDSDFTVEYKLNNATSIPNKAGSYKVTIAVTNDNYVLTGDTTFDYEITQKHISSSGIMWENAMFTTSATNRVFDNVLLSYISDIMTFLPQDFTISIDGGEPHQVGVTTSETKEHNKYYFDENGQLCITIETETSHVYKITFGLKENAKVNYVITGDALDGLVTRSFSAVGRAVKTVVTQPNWQYSDSMSTLVIKILVGDDEKEFTPTGSNYVVMYAPITDVDGAKALLAQGQTDGYSLEQVHGLYVDGSLSSTFDNFDVGYYVVCITYTGTVLDEGGDREYVAVRRFNVFEVTKKVLPAPTFTDVTYNGQTQTLTVNYNDDVNGVALNTIVSASYNSSNIANGGKINEVNAGSYEVYFSIKSGYDNRYTWALDSGDLDKIVTWTIKQDTADNSTNEYFEIKDATLTYGETYSPVNPNPKSGYEGTFTWRYATKGSTTDPSTIKTWSPNVPKNAGSYWIKVELSDTNNNFTTKDDYAVLTINKKELTLTPSGTLVYGNTFAQNNCSYDLVGFITGEDDKNVTLAGSVTYALKDASASLVVNGDTGYALVATSTLTADNYYVTVVEGMLTVTARKVTVTIDDATSQYKLPLAELTIKSISDSYAQGDSEFASSITLSTTATATSVVASYDITGVIDNDNYDVEFVKGTYTITQRDVTVTLTNGGGTYNKTITAVTYNATIADENGAEISLDQNEGFAISILYNNVATVPSNAGSYNVTVAASGNDNYVLANSPTETFVIDKFTVDKSMITVQEIVYTGKAIEPEISIKAGADYTKDVFSVEPHADFIEAGDDYEVVLKLNYSDNYKWSDSVNAYTKVTFVILRAGIYATPTGSITYGTAFDASTVTWKFVYALNGDDVITSEVNEITFGEVKFVFDREINLDCPLVDTYKITCEVDASGRVIGLNHDNYNITLKPNDADKYGDYVVNKKALTIVAGNSTSVYSQNPADYLSTSYTLDTTIAGNALVAGDVLTSVVKNYTPSIDATASSNVNTYTVTATAEADNYEITVKDGNHEILPIKVKISLKATDGSYHGTVATYGVLKLEATNLTEGYDFTKFDNDNLAYYFTGIGGTTYGSATFPTNAGKYEVTVTAINNVNGNFVIDDQQTVQTATFTIAKMIIDESAITVASKKYQGIELSHGLKDEDGYTVEAKTFKNVGTHNVTLTLTDFNNYEWSEHAQATSITKTFTITKAKLQLKPNGTITYGDSFEANVRNYGFELIGLVGDDVGADNFDIVSGTIKYLLANGADGSKLAVKEGGYAMTANVSELEADNYEIEVTDGVLTVERRNITIKPVASQSVYGQKVVLSNDFTLENGTTLANGDTNSDIEYLATCDANELSNVNTYDVTIAKAFNNNYNITILVGTHTIVKAKVGVTIRALNGIYGDVNNKGGIEFVSVEVIHEDGTTEVVTNLQFVVNYTGTAHDSSNYDDDKVPTKAGVYTATVRDVLSDNYELDRTHGISRTMFEISKRQIDARNIIAVSAEYTGKNIIPQIVDTLYNVNGQKIYNTVFNGELKNVGTYDITLSLVDTDNCEWEGNLNKTTTIKFVIVKANNSLVDINNPNAPASSVAVVIADWTFGSNASVPQAAVASGEQNIVFQYATSENGDYTTEVPKDAGEYWVRATVAASDNYNAYVSKATKFVISKKVVNLPLATNLDGNNVYTGNMLSLNIEGFDDQIMSLTLGKDMYRADNNGKLTLLALNANTYTATFKLRNANNYVWADTTNLEDGAVVVNWTVERQVVKKLSDATNKILVNGEDIVFIPEGFNSGIMTIDGNVRAHEGNYSAVVTLKDTQNYVWEGTESPSITVVFELTGTNVAFIAAICVVAGLCVGLAVMAVILTLVNRNKKRKEAEAIDARSRADGWEGE